MNRTPWLRERRMKTFEDVPERLETPQRCRGWRHGEPGAADPGRAGGLAPLAACSPESGGRSAGITTLGAAHRFIRCPTTTVPAQTRGLRLRAACQRPRCRRSNAEPSDTDTPDRHRDSTIKSSGPSRSSLNRTTLLDSDTGRLHLCVHRRSSRQATPTTFLWRVPSDFPML